MNNSKQMLTMLMLSLPLSSVLAFETPNLEAGVEASFSNGFFAPGAHLFSSLRPLELILKLGRDARTTAAWTYRFETEGVSTSMVFTSKAQLLEVVRPLEGCHLEVLTPWSTYSLD